MTIQNSNQFKYSVIVLAVIILAVLLGWLSWAKMILPEQATTSNGNIGGATLLPPPETTKQLVDTADLIIVGTIDHIYDQSNFYGYDQDAVERQSRDEDGSASMPITDYVIRVEEVILDDGTIARGDPVILRFIGEPAKNEEARERDITSDYPMSYVGDRNLLFLTQNPDGRTYGLYYGPWSRLIFDGTSVTYSDGAHTPINFTQNRQTSDFMEELKTLVDEINSNE